MCSELISSASAPTKVDKLHCHPPFVPSSDMVFNKTNQWYIQLNHMEILLSVSNEEKALLANKNIAFSAEYERLDKSVCLRFSLSY